jgi:hypothetical protein
MNAVRFHGVSAELLPARKPEGELMKRLLGVAAAVGGLFMGGSTGPMELDYISYSGAAISGYAKSEYFGAHQSVLPDDSGELAELVEPDPEHGFAGPAAVSSAAAAESSPGMEQPLQASVGNAYEPSSPFASISSTTESFPVGGPLLGKTGIGQGNSSKSKTAANESSHSPAVMSGRAAAPHFHRKSTPRREAGCARCSGSQWSSHPRILIAWLPTNLSHKHAHIQRERLSTGAAREREPRMLAALSF